jgi:hypothetical protein
MILWKEGAKIVFLDEWERGRGRKFDNIPSVYQSCLLATLSYSLRILTVMPHPPFFYQIQKKLDIA